MQIIKATEHNFLALKRGRIVLTDLEGNTLETGDRMYNFFLSFSGLMSRLLRTFIHASIKLSNGSILICSKNDIFLLNDQKLRLRKIQTPDRFSKSLTFCEININDVQYVLYSDYYSNPSKKQVSLYMAPLDNLDNYEVLHTFNDGEVNHIHSCVQDPKTGNILVNVGDEGNTVGIWEINIHKREILPILVGSQGYRSVISWFYNGEFFLLNDSPTKENYLLKIDFAANEKSVTKLHDIEGPVIYGLFDGRYTFFSTSVEPNGSESFFQRFSFVYPHKRKSYLYVYDNKTRRLTLINSGFKDFFNQTLFGFGSFKFPIQETSETLVVNKASLSSTSNWTDNLIFQSNTHEIYRLNWLKE